jgi:flagellar basal-body rod modification protein FlgD
MSIGFHKSIQRSKGGGTLTSINSINSYTAKTPSTQKSDPLGKDAFLKILVTQMQNQDSTQPMKDGEFISQMAQLSVMEQLSNLNQGLTAFLNNQMNNQIIQYSNVIDKKVSWNDSTTNQLESGIVTGIVYKNNDVYFKVGNQEILASMILSIETNQ